MLYVHVYQRDPEGKSETPICGSMRRLLTADTSFENLHSQVGRKPLPLHGLGRSKEGRLGENECKLVDDVAPKSS